MVYDLTNGSCGGSSCQGAAPSSPDNYYRRHIGAGFFTEWGRVDYYRGANFIRKMYWTKTAYYPNNPSSNVVYGVNSNGAMGHANASEYHDGGGLCVYPYPY